MSVGDGFNFGLGFIGSSIVLVVFVVVVMNLLDYLIDGRD